MLFRSASPARDLLPFRASAHHQQLDLFKIRHRLGYEDVVAVPDAIAETVEFFQQHRPEEDGEAREEFRLQYAVEDELAGIQREASSRMAELAHYNRDYHHSYAHPREPGQTLDHRKR